MLVDQSDLQVIRVIGQAALTTIPLLSAVLFGLIELWRGNQRITRRTFRGLTLLLALLTCNVAMWLAVDLLRVLDLKPEFAGDAVKLGAIATTVTMLFSVAVLVIQVLELVSYTRRAAGHVDR